jgi:hypothetical protein
MTAFALAIALIALGIAVGTALRVNDLNENTAQGLRGTITICCQQLATEEVATDLRIRALEARLARLERAHDDAYTPSRN